MYRRTKKSLGRIGKAFVLACFFRAGYSQHRKLGGRKERAGWFLHGQFDPLKIMLVFNFMYCAFVALKTNKISNILNHGCIVSIVVLIELGRVLPLHHMLKRCLMQLSST